MAMDSKKMGIPIMLLRGQKVILDSDLAKGLGYTTKALNQTRLRHSHAFPDSCCFQLSGEEVSVCFSAEAPIVKEPSSVTVEGGSCDRETHSRFAPPKNQYYPWAYGLEAIRFLSTILRKAGAKDKCALIESLLSESDQEIIKSIDSVGINEDWIRSKIHQIRGYYVLVDQDLATIYGYTLKQFNQQIKNNIERFDEDFMFQLSKDEVEANLRSKFLTSSWGGRRYLPYVFTELGVYMLPSVLRGELAVRQCKAIVRAFYELKRHYHLNQIPIINPNEFEELKDRVTKNEGSITSIRKDMDRIKNRIKDPNSVKYFILRNGERVFADEVYKGIYSKAKQSLVIVDDYIGIRTLRQVASCPKGIRLTFITNNEASDGVTQSMVDSFRKDRPDLTLVFLRSNKVIHDRLICIDIESKPRFRIFHCGGSSKNAGEKITFIQELPMPERYKDVIEEILKNPPLLLP